MSITGTEAIARMRSLRHDESLYFILYHLTFNAATQETNGLRIVEGCRLRPSLPDDVFKTDSDLYLPYFDL